MDTATIKRKLTTTAELQLQQYRELVSLVEEQREILIDNRHSDLEGNVALQDKTLAEISELDRQEEMLLEILAGTNDSPAPSHFEDGHREITAEIAQTAERLRSLVETNTELLANAVRFVDFSIGILSQLGNEQQSYNPNADPAGNCAIIFDRRV